MTAVVLALACAVLGLAVLVAGLLRSHAEVLRALHELGAGLELDRDGARTGPVPVSIDGVPGPRAGSGEVRATSINGSTLDDEQVALPLVGGGDTLLAFLSSGCTTCQEFWGAFARGVRDVPGDARLVVVAQDLADESASALRERAPTDLPLVLSSEAWGRFEVPGSPYFAYVDGSSGRVVGEGSAATWRAVVDLMAQARADDRETARAVVPAGSFRVSPDVSGNGAVRERRDDDALLAAGIGPGDPSLHRAAGDP